MFNASLVKLIVAVLVTSQTSAAFALKQGGKQRRPAANASFRERKTAGGDANVGAEPSPKLGAKSGESPGAKRGKSARLPAWLARRNDGSGALSITLSAVPNAVDGASNEMTLPRSQLVLRKTPTPIVISQDIRTSQILPEHILLAADVAVGQQLFVLPERVSSTPHSSVGRLVATFSDTSGGFRRDIFVTSDKRSTLFQAAKNGTPLVNESVRVKETITTAKGQLVAEKYASYGADGKQRHNLYIRHSAAGHIVEVESRNFLEGTGERTTLRNGVYIKETRHANGSYTVANVSRDLPASVRDAAAIPTPANATTRQ